MLPETEWHGIWVLNSIDGYCKSKQWIRNCFAYIGRWMLYSTPKPMLGVMIWYKKCGLRIYFVNSLQL